LGALSPWVNRAGREADTVSSVEIKKGGAITPSSSPCVFTASCLFIINLGQLYLCEGTFNSSGYTVTNGGEIKEEYTAKDVEINCKGKVVPVLN
jgi:hypothetical protein